MKINASARSLAISSLSVGIGITLAACGGSDDSPSGPQQITAA